MFPSGIYPLVIHPVCCIIGFYSILTFLSQVYISYFSSNINCSPKNLWFHLIDLLLSSLNLRIFAHCFSTWEYLLIDFFSLNKNKEYFLKKMKHSWIHIVNSFRFTIIEPYLFEVTFTLEILASQQQNGSCVIPVNYFHSKPECLALFLLLLEFGVCIYVCVHMFVYLYVGISICVWVCVSVCLLFRITTRVSCILSIVGSLLLMDFCYYLYSSITPKVNLPYTVFQRFLFLK